MPSAAAKAGASLRPHEASSANGHVIESVLIDIPESGHRQSKVVTSLEYNFPFEIQSVGTSKVDKCTIVGSGADDYIQKPVSIGVPGAIYCDSEISAFLFKNLRDLVQFLLAFHWDFRLTQRWFGNGDLWLGLVTQQWAT